MTIRKLRGEVDRMRQQVAKVTPPPRCDLFERIEKTAKIFELIELGAPVPLDLASPAEVEELREVARKFDFLDSSREAGL